MRFLIFAALCLGMIGTARCEEAATFKCTVKDFKQDSPHYETDKAFVEENKRRVFTIFYKGDTIEINSKTPKSEARHQEFKVVNRDNTKIFAIDASSNFGISGFSIGIELRPGTGIHNIFATLTDQTTKTVYIYHLECSRN